MTVQIRDSVVINNSAYIIYELPLELYWEQNKNKPSLFSWTTAMIRGYIAKWLIENKKLYLIHFFGECAGPPPPKVYFLKDLFPSAEKKVFAEWFTGELTIPMGEPIELTTASWGPKYEYYTTIKIQNGIVTDPGSFLIE